MSDDDHTDDIELTPQDFAECGWEEIVSGLTEPGYGHLSSAFEDASKQVTSEGKYSHGKMLLLLSHICSMMLEPLSTNEPYKPFIVWQGKRSMIPDDLSENELSIFAQVVDDIGDPWLRGRLADLVWHRGKPRNVRFALTAIDAYRSIPLEGETWISDGRECWERAISLAISLGEVASERLREMERAVLDAFNSATSDDGFWGLWMAELLETNRLGRENKLAIAQKFEQLAGEIRGKGDLHCSREYFDASARWYQQSKDETKAVEMTVAVAESWVAEAEARISSDQPSHMVAAMFYEKAIQIYRKIPGKARATHGVDERIAELQTRLAESGKRSLEEMSVISSGPIDITEIVEQARNSVRGKNDLEALKAFANLCPGFSVEQQREVAIEGLRENPLHGLFGATVRNSEGRVVAKKPGMSLGDELSDDDESAIRAEMIYHYNLNIGLIVQGQILPALEVLLLEHRFREAYFVGLANQSSIIPIGRAPMFGKALFAGFDRDFVTAIHILVPQVEHLVRCHLKSNGVKTTNLDSNGIEDEIGLNALMERSEVEEIFGKNTASEIKTLFCDSLGSNLRNLVAHGLLELGACFSTPVIYAWWFSFRLVFNIFLSTTQKSDPGDE